MKTSNDFKWNLGHVIGRGSTGTVSTANDVISGEVFAVKSAELALSSMLQREQRILSALSSPYIISYLGFDISSDSSASSRLLYNLFLEYAPEGSLSDEIKKLGRLDEARIRSFARDIVRGLVYLHSVGVVHCDIKPSNILVCSEGYCKIGDFGCARWLEEDLQLSGTPMFMAPEVARGDEQGIEADVWALGCTILEMATGGSPWTDVSDPFAAIHRIAFSDDVPNLPDNLSDEGKDFLAKCLRRDPKQRWAAQQLLEHPFLAFSLFEKSKIVTPKTVLDQQIFLDSSSDEEDDEPIDECFVLHDFQQLLCEEPNWAWDENWITVRSNSVESISIDINETSTVDDVDLFSSEYACDFNSFEHNNNVIEDMQFLRCRRNATECNCYSIIFCDCNYYSVIHNKVWIHLLNSSIINLHE